MRTDGELRFTNQVRPDMPENKIGNITIGNIASGISCGRQLKLRTNLPRRLVTYTTNFILGLPQSESSEQPPESESSWLFLLCGLLRGGVSSRGSQGGVAS